MTDDNEPDGAPREGVAVCFPMGVPTIHFGAGAAHAFLVSDAPPPTHVAGVSAGAVAAAALQQVFLEKQRAREDAAQQSKLRGQSTLPPDEQRPTAAWRWLRRYANELPTAHEQVWGEAVPNRTSLLLRAAERPVEEDLPAPADPTAPWRSSDEGGPSVELREAVEQKTAEANAQHRFRVASIVRWLSGFRTQVQEVATAIEAYVVVKEHASSRRAVTLAAMTIRLGVELQLRLLAVPGYLWPLRATKFPPCPPWSGRRATTCGRTTWVRNGPSCETWRRPGRRCGEGWPCCGRCWSRC